MAPALVGRFFTASTTWEAHESESHSVMSDSSQPQGLYSPWNSLGQNTGVGSLSLLQGNLPNPGIEPRSPTLWADSLPAEPPEKPRNTGVGSLFILQWIYLTQESNRGLLHCRRILYQLSYEGSLRSPYTCTYIYTHTCTFRSELWIRALCTFAVLQVSRDVKALAQTLWLHADSSWSFSTADLVQEGAKWIPEWTSRQLPRVEVFSQLGSWNHGARGSGSALDLRERSRMLPGAVSREWCLGGGAPSRGRWEGAVVCFFLFGCAGSLWVGPLSSCRGYSLLCRDFSRQRLLLWSAASRRGLQ